MNLHHWHFSFKSFSPLVPGLNGDSSNNYPHLNPELVGNFLISSMIKYLILIQFLKVYYI